MPAYLCPRSCVNEIYASPKVVGMFMKHTVLSLQKLTEDMGNTNAFNVLGGLSIKIHIFRHGKRSNTSHHTGRLYGLSKGSGLDLSLIQKLSCDVNPAVLRISNFAQM